MDRERERDRRPFPREDQYGDSRGQSYRPARSPHGRPDTYRAPRSPARGSGFVDSYRAPPRGRSRSPPPFRRRSRSPPPFQPRLTGDSYRGRARSPLPRREFGGRDTTYRPGPPRAFRDAPAFDGGHGRSPLRAPRDRSPPPLKRGREISPAGSRGRRSPPPPKRERLASPPRSRYNAYSLSRDPSPPRGRPYSPPAAGPRRLTPPRGVTRAYRPASRSPLRRNEHNNPRKVEWRRRSPSPARQSRPDLITGETSGAPSVTSSRRSSPPIHPSRLAVIDPDEVAPKPAPRDDFPARQPYRARSPPASRPRSPIPSRPRSPLPQRPRSPPPQAIRQPSPPPVAARSPPPPVRSPKRRASPPRERDAPPTGPRIPPTGPASYEEAPPQRAPPTGPGATRSYAQAATEVPIPTGPRPSASSPPTHPRGAGPPGRGGFQRDYVPRGDYQGRGRGGPYAGPWRGGRGGGGGGGPAPPHVRDQEYPAAPPSGPRNSFSQAAPFRQNQAPAGAYARNPRFAPNGAAIPSGPKADMAVPPGLNDRNSRPPTNPYLADLPRIVDGGQKAPDLYDRSRVLRLEDEAEKLRRVIEDKQTQTRRGLREWERLGRESEGAAFRAQLAEDSVRALAGEGDGGAAF